VNTPRCEIIRGEVSIFRGGAGGIFFEVSSGSFSGSLCTGAGVCPEAMGIRSSELRVMEKLRAKSVEDLIVELNVERLKW
jgi:hypothetical protein